MKRILHFIIAVIAAVTWPAWAQNVSDPGTEAPGASQADNTERNLREGNPQTPTPPDQSNRPSDLEITAQIRKGIMDAPNLSVNARNVKIITQEGRVTLRGPVETPEEKQLIGEIANRVARPEQVTNELDVKRPSGTP